MPTALEKKVNPIVKDFIERSAWVDYSRNRLSLEGAKVYVKQHGIFTRHSRRCWAYVVGNCPVIETRRFIVTENLYEEEGIEEKSHFNMLVASGKAMGLSEKEMIDAVPLQSTRAAFLIWETLTRDRHWLIGCAAKAALEQGNQPECGQFALQEGRRWMEKLINFSEADVDFWIKHDELDQVHGSGAFELVEKYLAQTSEVTEADIIEAVEDSMAGMKLFFDGIGEMADEVAK